MGIAKEEKNTIAVHHVSIIRCAKGVLQMWMVDDGD